MGLRSNLGNRIQPFLGTIGSCCNVHLLHYLDHFYALAMALAHRHCRSKIHSITQNIPPRHTLTHSHYTSPTLTHTLCLPHSHTNTSSYSHLLTSLMHIAALALQIDNASGLWILSYDKTQVKICVSCCHPSKGRERERKIKELSSCPYQQSIMYAI